MKQFFFYLFLAAAISCFAQDDSKYVKNTFLPATVLLYSQSEDGNMKMRCTATAIEKNATGYVFVTAAHCACVDDTTLTTVTPEQTTFFITTDETKHKEFMKAEPIGCGYRHRGDDFVLFQVDTKDTFPIIPLGKDPVVMDPIINVASPLGLGKQVFKGIVSSAKLDRSVVVDDINWSDAILLQLFGVNGGSSGSAILCTDQQAICGFVVGNIEHSTMVAMPVSRLITLKQSLNKGTYKYWEPEKQPKSFSLRKAD